MTVSNGAEAHKDTYNRTSFLAHSAAERQANVDELRRYADLAAELGANYVRAFLGELPEGTNLDSFIYERISDCQCCDPLV